MATHTATAAATLHLSAPHDNCLGAATVKVLPSVRPPPVDMSLHADNRARLVARLRAGGAPADAVVLLQGGPSLTRHETDHEPLFRQESTFHWAFGVREPDFYGSIDVGTGRAALFVPRLPEAYAVWMGEIKTPAQWRAIYEVDDVFFVDELPQRLRTSTSDSWAARTVLVLRGLNSDSKNWATPASFEGLSDAAAFAVDASPTLWDAVVHLRTRKTPKEQALLRFAATVSSEAHLAVMQHARPGLAEYQLESLFRHWCYYHGGARHLSYTCICASGGNGAVLHYGHAGEPNARMLKAGDMCLFDMGSEFHCYGSDITASWPASGVFSPDQRLVYEAVLAAVVAVLDAMRPGVSWVDMHELAYRCILTHLRDGGLLTGDVDAMLAAELGAVFMPHGLGHMLGIDTHDVGGYEPGGPPRPARPGFDKLRTAAVLEEGMLITVEPGVYFIPRLLAGAAADLRQARFLVPEALARFAGFGGVRLEDDVLVTAAGCDNLSHVPRTVADVEAVMAGRITQRAQLTKFH